MAAATEELKIYEANPRAFPPLPPNFAPAPAPGLIARTSEGVKDDGEFSSNFATASQAEGLDTTLVQSQFDEGVTKADDEEDAEFSGAFAAVPQTKEGGASTAMPEEKGEKEKNKSSTTTEKKVSSSGTEEQKRKSNKSSKK